MACYKPDQTMIGGGVGDVGDGGDVDLDDIHLLLWPFVVIVIASHYLLPFATIE